MTDNTHDTNTAAQTPAQQTSTDTASSGQSQSAKTFTQAELDHHAGERAKRAADAAVKKILGKLGVASEDELDPLKTTIEESRKRKLDEMSESEKAKAELEVERKRRETLESELNAERTARRNDTIASHVQSEAAKLKADDTETVLLYAREKHRAALDALMNEDGTMDGKKVAALLEAIKAEKPKYFTAAPTGTHIPSNQGRGTPAQAQADAQKRAYQTNQKLIRG
jgi:hypothetical protein